MLLATVENGTIPTSDPLLACSRTAQCGIIDTPASPSHSGTAQSTWVDTDAQTHFASSGGGGGCCFLTATSARHAARAASRPVAEVSGQKGARCLLYVAHDASLLRQMLIGFAPHPIDPITAFMLSAPLQHGPPPLRSALTMLFSPRPSFLARSLLKVLLSK